MTDHELQSLRNMGNECERAADEIERLRADKAALLEDLAIAMQHCCNSYWDDGHAERVCARWGIADTTKGEAP